MATDMRNGDDDDGSLDKDCQIVMWTINYTLPN